MSAANCPSLPIPPSCSMPSLCLPSHATCSCGPGWQGGGYSAAADVCSVHICRSCSCKHREAGTPTAGGTIAEVKRYSCAYHFSLHVSCYHSLTRSQYCTFTLWLPCRLLHFRISNNIASVCAANEAAISSCVAAAAAFSDGVLRHRLHNPSAVAALTAIIEAVTSVSTGALPAAPPARPLCTLRKVGNYLSSFHVGRVQWSRYVVGRASRGIPTGRVVRLQGAP